MTLEEDDFDVRPFINALLGNWKLILFLTILGALAGFSVSLLQPPLYRGTATLIVTRSQLQLSLADQFTTVSENNDTKSQMDAFLAIANSDGITRAVHEAIGEKFPPNFSNGKLADAVETVNRGDAILISTIAEDPDLAADIANTWAQEASRAINRAYSGEQPLTEIQVQISEAKNEYERTQTDLENFTAGDQTDLLQSQITAKSLLLASLAEDQTAELNFYSDRRRLMGELIIQAEVLKEQVASGSQSASGRFGDNLAVMYARANAMGLLEPRNIGIEAEGIRSRPPGLSFDFLLSDLDSLAGTGADLSSDLDILIDLAGTEIERADQALLELASRSAEENPSEIQLIVALHLQDLQTQLEQVSAEGLQLVSERDLAWETYQALQEKETEILTTADTSNIVVIASPAIPSDRPDSSQTILKTALGGFLGFMLGTIWVLGFEWWRSDDSSDEQLPPSSLKSIQD